MFTCEALQESDESNLFGSNVIFFFLNLYYIKNLYVWHVTVRQEN